MAEGLTPLCHLVFSYIEKASIYLLRGMHSMSLGSFVFCSKDGFVGRHYWNSCWRYSHSKTLGLLWASVSSSKNGYKKIYLTY